MTVSYNKLGPGTLELGEVGTAVDYSCQLTGATIAWDASKDDDVTTVCGDTLPGATTYTAVLSGTAVQDLADAAGLAKFSWDNKGQPVAVSFVPSTEAGATFTGVVTIGPLDVGGDTAGENMTSDFEWPFVGDPVWEDALPLGFGAAVELEDVDA